MHRARFVNPFDARYDGAVVVVTRCDVFSPPPDAPAVEGIADDLRQLDKLVRARVDVDLEHSPRPTKRRKLSEGAAASSVSFRLFARSETREISLVPKEHPARKRERPVEDTHEERQLRRRRAQQIIVEAPLSTQTHLLPSRTQTTTFQVVSDHPGPSTLSPLCVASIPKQTSSRPRNPRLDWTHATDRVSNPVSCCPSLNLQPPAPLVGTENKRRRRRRLAEEGSERAPAVFWRPPPDLGGKSAGYALGWPASTPGAVGYLRCGKHTLSKF